VGGNMKDDVQFYKLNEEDILDIINDYLSQKSNYKTLQSKLLLLGTPNKDLRVLAAITPCMNEQIDNLDLAEIDENIDYNGEHSSLSHSTSIDTTDIGTQSMIKKLLEKLEDE
jgi:hypothetical protein